MKFIFVVVVVCTFVQSFFSNINGNRVNETELFNTSFIDSDFEKELVAMQQTTAKTISNAFVDCYRNTEIPVKEAVDLFHNPRWGEVREEPVEVKCLVDCVMRKTHLMTDQGLDVERYMVFVKQLRHNYTTFDINSKSGVAKDKIMNTIAKRALLLKNYDRIVFESNHYASCKLKSPRLNLCHELIESYALAARKCKDVKDPKGDACATSFEVMRCIMKENRSRTFNSPFLPDVSPRQIFG